MTTKPKFSAAPKPPALTVEQTAFIEKGRGKDRPKIVGPMARVSIDLPKKLHLRFKSACALADTKMTAEIIAFIEERTNELEVKNSIKD